MSFLFLNAESGQILNILPDRRMPALIRYFMSYSRKAREAVKTVCMDMYSPYFSVVHHCFPHAKILTASTSFSCSAALSIRPASIS